MLLYKSSNQKVPVTSVPQIPGFKNFASSIPQMSMSGMSSIPQLSMSGMSSIPQLSMSGMSSIPQMSIPQFYLFVLIL